MTSAQRTSFYFPIWNQTCKALGWRMTDGRLDLGDMDALNAHSQKVIAAGKRLAHQWARSATLDDLRHGVTIVVLGKDKPTNNLTTREVDQVTAFMKLMREETNLAADATIDHPETSHREAIIATIHRLRIPRAVLDDHCRHYFPDSYDGRNWDQLPLPQLRGLVQAMKHMAEEYQREFVAQG